MTSYLLEFRLSGYARHYAKDLIYSVARKFHVKGVTERRVVPHVTLVGPFSTIDEKRLIRELEDVGSNLDLITFKLNGFRSFGNRLTGKRVLVVNIEPSPELIALRQNLVRRLDYFCKLSKYDKKEFKPHATVAFKDIDRKFDQIKKFLDSTSPPSIQHYVLRITLLRGGKILREYDLLQRRLLTRRQALNRDMRKTTFRFLKCRRQGTDVGYTPDKPVFLPPDSKVFLISDTHFDHANIIRFCYRPFRTREEMNEVLVRNWNSIVGIRDTVYFLGDLTFGSHHHSIDYWLGRLNGRKFFVRGNHDTDLITKAVEIPNNYSVKRNGYTFLLTHKPIRPSYWGGWIIHGEKHNSNVADYPFINHAKRTINVSAEIVEYKPISLDDIASAIDNFGKSQRSSN